MEAIANQAYKMLKKFDLKPGVIVNVTTPETSSDGVWLGGSGADKADCYSQRSAGEAIKVNSHLKTLNTSGLGFTAYTDVHASLQREGGNPEMMARFGEFLKEHGAVEIFSADDHSPDEVSLAFCDDGAAGDLGTVKIVMPVWCSEAGTEITIRVLICETAASSYFTCFSSTFLR